MDHVVPYRPATCEHCCADLAKGALTGSVVNHWVYELPEIRPIITDHQCLDVTTGLDGDQIHRAHRGPRDHLPISGPPLTATG